MIIAFALKYWRLIAVAVTTAAAAYAIHCYGSQRFAAGAQSIKDTDLAALAQQLADNESERRRLDALRQQTDEELSHAKEALERERAARAPSVIRVCNRTNNPQSMPAVSGTGSETASPSGGELQQAAGEGTGTDFNTSPLYRVTDEADDEHLECEALKSWVEQSLKKPASK